MSGFVIVRAIHALTIDPMHSTTPWFGVSVIQEVARRELAQAEQDGFCGFCFRNREDDGHVWHRQDCKAVTHAGTGRTRARTAAELDGEARSLYERASRARADARRRTDGVTHARFIEELRARAGSLRNRADVIRGRK